MTDSTLIVAQVLGLLAMSMDIGSTFLTNDRRLVQAIALSSAIFAVHFFLLGGTAGAISEAVTVGRSLAAVYLKFNAVGVAFVVGYFVMGVQAALAGQWMEVLPYVAGCAGTTAMFWCVGTRLRSLFMLGQSCWLAYSVTSVSVGGTILYAILIFGTLRTAVQIRMASSAISTR